MILGWRQQKRCERRLKIRQNLSTQIFFGLVSFCAICIASGSADRVNFPPVVWSTNAFTRRGKFLFNNAFAVTSPPSRSIAEGFSGSQPFNHFGRPRFCLRKIRRCGSVVSATRAKGPQRLNSAAIELVRGFHRPSDRSSRPCCSQRPCAVAKGVFRRRVAGVSSAAAR